MLVGNRLLSSGWRGTFQMKNDLLGELARNGTGHFNTYMLSSAFWLEMGQGDVYFY
jgi:hypothetical protein